MNLAALSLSLEHAVQEGEKKTKGVFCLEEEWKVVDGDKGESREVNK